MEVDPFGPIEFAEVTMIFSRFLVLIAAAACGCALPGGANPPGPGFVEHQGRLEPTPTATARQGSPAPGHPTEPEETADQTATHYKPPEPLENTFPSLSEVAEGCRPFDTPFIEFTITANGTTEDHRFLQSTRCERADNLLMEYVRQWTFHPATVDGEPVAEEHYTTAIHWWPVSDGNGARFDTMRMQAKAKVTPTDVVEELRRRWTYAAEENVRLPQM